ncbi:MAG: zinc ribbon domain-containing protein [Syntrophales bacterium]|nr:zinc ribbon domain-containing protein [Syntrophales bacterium]MCK9527151.1 zinc ribbon domain-containing protein [Syntrophales bacterium]MDX9921724.1 zinc ribbon domain-containing protein [Syntrophales bacterium]
MPIYDYHCGKCKKEFTVTRSISDRDKGVPACPKCKGKRQVSQLVSNFTAITSRKS